MLLVLAACVERAPLYQEDASCEMVQTAQEVAGGGAEDCGTYGLDEHNEQGWDCGIAAYQSGRPFYLIFEEQSGMAAFAATNERLFFLAQYLTEPSPSPISGYECLEAGVNDVGYLGCGEVSHEYYSFCGEPCESCIPYEF
jgi:hypothetical protein